MMRTLATAAGILLLAGCAGADAAPQPSSPSPAATASAAPPGADDADTVAQLRAPTVLGEVEIQDTSPETLAALRAEPPQRLAVASLGIDMPVREVGLVADGSMEIPESTDVAGWYRFGPAPGAASGNAVLAAHVDDAEGLGPFGLLRDVSEGERISVTSSSGEQIDYVVERVEQTSKRTVDMDLVFDRGGAPQLVLVTCGGRFDWSTGHYEDNVVVYASPVSD